jgi:hypothetical protein
MREHFMPTFKMAESEDNLSNIESEDEKIARILLFFNPNNSTLIIKFSITRSLNKMMIQPCISIFSAAYFFGIIYHL